MTRPDDDGLDAAMAEYLALVERGRRPDRAGFLAAHPHLAPALAPLLDDIDALNGVARQLGSDAAAGACAPVFDRHARIGEFEVVRVIGRGGMGVVYEAVETRLGRRVALKVLPTDAAIDPQARRRFLREAQTAAVLQHPNIVPVLSVGEAAGVQYYAMPLIDGQSLDAVLRVLRHRDGIESDDGAADPSSHAALLATGLTVGFGAAGPAATPASVRANPLYLDAVVRLARDAALALAYAHDGGVVHRDVKPGNLILDVRGKVWLTDFGLAKAASAGLGPTTVGRAGTLRYMSPEQAAGRSAEVDARTDVYALGLTLHELLTLRPAFAAVSDTDLLRQIATADPPSVRRVNPAVSEDLETVVQKATAKERADRYESAAAFAADLGRVRDGLPVLARRLTRPQRARRWAGRHRRRLAGIGGAVVAGVVLGLAASTSFLLTAFRDADAQRSRLEAREADLMAFVEQFNRTELELKELPGAQAKQRELVYGLHAVLSRAADEPGSSVRVRGRPSASASGWWISRAGRGTVSRRYGPPERRTSGAGGWPTPRTPPAGTGSTTPGVACSSAAQSIWPVRGRGRNPSAGPSGCLPRSTPKSPTTTWCRTNWVRAASYWPRTRRQRVTSLPPSGTPTRPWR